LGSFIMAEPPGGGRKDLGWPAQQQKRCNAGDCSRGAAVTGVGCAAAWNGSVRVGGHETLDKFIDIARLGQSTLGELVGRSAFFRPS